MIVRRAAAAGVLIALVVLVLVAVVFPDEGASPASAREAVAISAVFAAAPIAALAPASNARLAVALGGGTALAGAAVTQGGNLLGPMLALTGLLILLAGASRRPAPDWRLIGLVLGYGIVLGLAMWLTIGTGIALSPRLAVVRAVSGLSLSHQKYSGDRGH
jgi:hypothetical protein